MSRKSKKRRKRKGELVCHCRAYKFPHRLLGGRCTGRGWVFAFFEEQASGTCRGYRYLYFDDGFQCEVCDGREPPHECPEFSDFLARNEVTVPKKLGVTCW